jgi:hypothetical protein
MHVSFKIHYRNNLIDDERYGHQLYSSVMCNPGKIVLCPTLQFGQIVIDGSVGQYHKRQTDITTSIESSLTKAYTFFSRNL